MGAIQDQGHSAVIQVSYVDGILSGANSYRIELRDDEFDFGSIELSSGDRLFLWDPSNGLRPYVAENKDIEVMSADLNGTGDIVLTKNPATGETKVWQTLIGDQRVQLPTDYFFYSDVPYSYDDRYNINTIAVYKDRVYAGCDNGLVIVFTSCIKCYQLRSVSSFDIKTMEIEDGIMTVSDGEKTKTIDMSEIGGDTIEPDEALVLYQNGAVLADVRSPEEFAEYSYEGSVNLPVDDIEELLDEYDRGTVFIFYCAAGVRAEKALRIAREMGFSNVYNLGSVDKLR